MRVAKVNAQWRSVLTEAFTAAAREYDVDVARFPIETIVALVMTFNEGIQLERMSGIRDGHDELLAAIDQLLTSLAEPKTNRRCG